MEIYISYFLFSILITFFLLKYYLEFAKKKRYIDNQNPHYNNKPTPTGSGIIFLIIFLFGNAIFINFIPEFKELLPNRFYIFISSLIILVIICFKDDIKPIDPILRLIVQIVLIYLSITALDLKETMLPIKVTFLLAVVIWIYIMNITNFVDGSDGFLSLNMFFYWGLILLISYFYNIELFSKYISILVLPIILVFFIYNKPVAKLYMGDAGSIFFGFLTGYSFLEIIINGYWNIALSLLIYPILDCSICLVRKFFRGHMPWVGLYDYYFLIPVLRNKSNHRYLLYFFTLFHILNSLIIYMQINYNNSQLIILNFLLSLLMIGLLGKVKIEKIFGKII